MMRTNFRRVIGVLALLFACVTAMPEAAWPHASLLRTEPADGALVAEPPAVIRLWFNEPVRPLLIRLLGPDGAATEAAISAEEAVVTVRPSPLGRGTHLLSWRVVSADGHPVGGALLFSVGAASPPPGAAPQGDPVAGIALWAAKFALYVALFIGLGGMLTNRMLRIEGTERARPLIAMALPLAAAVAALSIGLQGLDALALPLPALLRAEPWRAGLGTSYGLTGLVLLAALVIAWIAGTLSSPRAKYPLVVLALGLAGVALAASGHASNASPQLVTRPAVFLHVVCAMIWMGALLPLMTSLRRGERAPLQRFSRLIPGPLSLLVATGALLGFAQFDRLDALWTTNYGLVLAGKLSLVGTILTIGVLNRFVLQPRLMHGDAAAGRLLVRTVGIELALMLLVMALIASWRFTPPPRALAAAAPVELHLHGARAMVHLTITPVRGREPRVELDVLDGEFQRMPVKEVTLSLAPLAGDIEAIRRVAVGGTDELWRLAGLSIPLAGRWTVRVDLLIDDFERLSLEAEAELPRLP